MTKIGSKNMVFKTEEEEHGERLSCKLTVDKGIELFLAAKSKKWKPSTRAFYQQRLAVLKAAASGNGAEYIEDLVPKFARRYRAHRQGQVSDPTVHHDEVAMKMLTKWCAANEHIARDPLAHYQALPMKEADPKVRRPAKQWELDKIVKVIENWLPLETAEGSKHERAQEYRYVKARDRMVVLTMIEMAGRSGEVISLTKCDLHRDDSYLHVHRSGMADTRKNKEELLAPVSPAWWKEMDAFLEKRPTLNDADLLFPLTNGQQMDSGQWANRFRTYCKKAGVDGLVSHCIRHAGASQEREVNGDLAALRKIGDASMQSLERYTRQAGKSMELRHEQHARTAPLASFLSGTGEGGKSKTPPAVYKQ